MPGAACDDAVVHPRMDLCVESDDGISPPVDYGVIAAEEEVPVSVFPGECGGAGQVRRCGVDVGEVAADDVLVVGGAACDTGAGAYTAGDVVKVGQYAVNQRYDLTADVGTSYVSDWIVAGCTAVSAFAP